MRRIFLDNEQEEFFSANGYIKLPFGRTDEIDETKEQIYSLSPSDDFKASQKSLLHDQDFHCTFFDNNIEYRSRAFEIISNFFAPACQSVLYNYRFIQANVFIKPPHQGYVAPHQNLTVVDESKFSSLSFWCPVQDTDANNGTMVVVPGSHKKFMKYRNTNVSWPLLPLFQNYDSPLLKTIEVKRGEFLIIDDSLIHGTTNNTTGFERFIIHAVLAPVEAELLYCDIEKEKNKVKIMRVPEKFWQFYLPGTTPTGLELWEERIYNEGEQNAEEVKAELYGQRLD